MAATLRPWHPPLRSIFRPLSVRPSKERTDDSERKSDGSRRENGIGERRRHDLMAPLIYPRRASKKPMRGGSSSWLLCGLTFFAILHFTIPLSYYSFPRIYGYIPLIYDPNIYGTHTHTRHFNHFIYDKPIGPAARVSVNNCCSLLFFYY
jgi:hypothetical protein